MGKFRNLGTYRRLTRRRPQVVYDLAAVDDRLCRSSYDITCDILLLSRRQRRSRFPSRLTIANCFTPTHADSNIGFIVFSRFRRVFFREDFSRPAVVRYTRVSRRDAVRFPSYWPVRIRSLWNYGRAVIYASSARREQSDDGCGCGGGGVVWLCGYLLLDKPFIFAIFAVSTFSIARGYRLINVSDVIVTYNE